MDRPTAQVLAAIVLLVAVGIPWLVGMWTLIERVLNG